MPKVSVIIPTYNRANYIGEAIESVLAQTYQDYEIIVVDDGSTDNTRKVLEQFDGHIEYIYQENRGEAAARNTGLLVSKGEYLVLLDSDDTILPQKLERQVAFLDTHPSVGVVYSDLYFVDEDGKQLMLHSAYKGKKGDSGNVLEALIRRGNFIPVHSAMVRRSCFDVVGQFNESLFIGTDWEMWLRLAEQYTFQYIDIPSGNYRVHAGMSLAPHSPGRLEKAAVAHREVENAPYFQKVSKEARVDFYKRYGRIQFIAGNMSEGRKLLRKAIALNAWDVESYVLLCCSLLGRFTFKRIVRLAKKLRCWIRGLPSSPFPSD